LNYLKIYNSILDKAEKEKREKTKECSYERHHKVPRSMGGSNDKSNLVLLTLKEHFIAHLLLVNITKGTQDYYKMSQAFILMSGRVSSSHKRASSKTYERCKQVTSTRMSELWKDALIVKDVKTGVMIGHVPKNHINVISGKWVFFHKGMKRSDEYKKKISKNTVGSLNPNAYTVTNEQIYEYAVEFFTIFEKYSYQALRNYVHIMYKVMLPIALTKYRDPVRLIKVMLVNEQIAEFNQVNNVKISKKIIRNKIEELKLDKS